MPERERAQERAERRGRHHPERQHALRRARPQYVGVINVRAARHDRRDQRQDLAARTRAADPAPEPHRRVHQRLEAQPDHQRGRRDQTRVRNQRLVVEDHLNAIDPARYSTHRKCLLDWRQRRRKTPSSSQLRRHFPRIRELAQPLLIGGSRLSLGFVSPLRHGADQRGRASLRCPARWHPQGFAKSLLSFAEMSIHAKDRSGPFTKQRRAEGPPLDRRTATYDVVVRNVWRRGYATKGEAERVEVRCSKRAHRGRYLALELFTLDVVGERNPRLRQFLKALSAIDDRSPNVGDGAGLSLNSITWGCWHNRRWQEGNLANRWWDVARLTSQRP